MTSDTGIQVLAGDIIEPESPTEDGTELEPEIEAESSTEEGTETR
jgi:hypothetical protein